MLKNYLKAALRNMAREKAFTAINIFGLAIGIACCLLIYQFVKDEFTYDSFHEKADRIFRVLEVSYDADGSERSSNSNHPVPLGPALRADLPEVIETVRFREMEHFVRWNGDATKEAVLYADPVLFQVFTFPLIAGNPRVALSDIKSVVISESVAERFFGTNDPVGQGLFVRIKDKFEEFLVTGVARNAPGNSSISFDIILPFENLYTYFSEYPDFPTSWNWISIQTYVELAETTNLGDSREKLLTVYRKYFPNRGGEGQFKSSFGLQPVKNIHLASVSSPRYSYILSGIALIILLIACINFMTLSIGRSSKRALEVGLRKVVGARRGQLLVQYWGEAVIHSGLALVMGLMLAVLLLPVFNELSGKQLTIRFVGDALSIAVGILLALAAGLIAGSYPALMLAGVRPVQIFRRKLKLSGSNLFTRSLLVLQFTLTIFLIVSTRVMTSQLDYTRSKDLGYYKEQIVILETNGVNGVMVADRMRAILPRMPGVMDITATSNTLGRNGTSGTRYRHEGKTHSIAIFAVEPNYIEFMGLRMLEGRNFNPGENSGSRRMAIVNEALVRDFDLEDPVGKAIPGFPGGPGNEPIIIGVVKDYHFQSLYRDIIPVCLSMDQKWGYDYILARIRPGGVAESIVGLEKAWQEFVPEVPFVYRFMDDEMQAQYLRDQRWERIVRYASFFAILIACLGLLGLTAITVSSRTREIGIRKVLGATALHITALISNEFVKLVLLANLIAWPIAWYVMNQWLENFAYRTEMNLWVFALGGGLALIVALLTVSTQAIKAALANPADSIRHE